MRHLSVQSVILLTALGGALMAQAPPFVMVNSASYAAASSPDALATIFGSSLAATTATAVLDAAGNLPTDLAGTRVEIAGVAAPLIYISPAQINLVVPAAIDPGTVDVVIRSTATGTSRSTSTFLRNAAPGVFTNDASGAGPGAILNAVTFAPAPFLVQTPENGADTRTRLAVYGTGFRNAKIVTATATDPTGNRYNLAVEFAGKAPGFFGLDQVNVVLIPELDGAGSVTLALGADANPANPVTFQVNLLPPAALALSALAISPAVVNAGDIAQLTVGINGVARAGGFPVALRSSSTAAQVTQQLTIPQGSSTAQTSVNTIPGASTVNPTITAQAGGVLLSTTLEIDPVTTVQLAGVSVVPTSVLGGRSVVGTVTLSGNAPAAGVNILLSADSDRVGVPALVNVPFGKSSVAFPISTLVVTQPLPVTLMATLSRVNVTATLTVLPLLQLSLDQSSVVAGTAVTGMVTLAEPAPVTGATITMQSSDGVARVPGTVTVASGQLTQSFPITTTSPVTSARVVTITATYLGQRQTIQLTVSPQTAATLSALSIVPNPVTGGTTAVGTITLTGQAVGPTLVTLFSNSAIAFVPASVTVPQGQPSTTFNITTIKGLIGNATITASMPGISKSVTLSVQ
uniref:IPT/TIG domain-containing protein n=1 Tax=Solibacter usitatus (strain Ellin6076) TaxID=234267 RepID=Q02AS0_SOLUE